MITIEIAASAIGIHTAVIMIPSMALALCTPLSLTIHRQQPQRDSAADGEADLLEEESHNGIDNGGIAFARF